MKNKGITLIALVITIIVLLILAGVSIATLTGDNGILTQAGNAKDNTRGASVQEAIDLWKANKNADELAGTSTAQTKDELLNQLLGEKLLTAEEKTKLAAGETITIGNKNIILAKTLIEQFNAGEIKIGDYVDYTPVAGSTSVTKEETGYDAVQSYTVDTTTTWRVLGLSEDGEHLLLISGSPIKKEGEDPYLILQGAESYYNCEDALDKICSIYKNDLADEARSIRIEDINRTLGITVDKTENKVYKTSDSEKTNIDLCGAMGQTYTYESGDYAPENYLKETYPSNEKYQSLTSKVAGNTVPADGYYYSYTDSNIVEQGGTIYNLLFKGATSSENYAKSYWLASPGAGAYDSYACFGPGIVSDGYAASGYPLFHSNGFWRAYEFGVRPVVSLKSNITENEVKVIAGEEHDWSTSPDFESDGTLSGTAGQVVSSGGERWTSRTGIEKKGKVSQEGV